MDTSIETKRFFTKKRIIWGGVSLVVILGIWYLAFGRSSAGAGITVGQVTTEDLKKTVLTTGQVVSATDLDLSFQSSGVVAEVRVKEGDKVYAGQTLAVLDQTAAVASVRSAQANYDKVVAAATTADVAVSQASVDSAQTNLQNAQDDLSHALSTTYSTANATVLTNTNGLFSNPQTVSPQFTISGTVQTNQQLVSNINSERVAVNEALSAWQTSLGTISSANSDQVANTSRTNLLTISNYLADLLNLITNYTQLTTGGSATTLASDQSAVASAKTTIDGLSTTIMSDVQAVRSAQAALVQAQAALALKQSPARPEDVNIAQAGLQTAQVALHNTVITAPTSGTITEVDTKIGEQASAMQKVMVLQNVDNLHAEALVSEADIASVKVGQTIDNTFDALGPDKHFTSTVLTVNPASTVQSGVVDYKVTGDLKNIPDIRPGMTVNMTILVAEKPNTLAVPSSAIINQNGTQFVKVVDDPKKKTYHQVQITTGLEADGGLTEITSGVTAGQSIVTYIK